MFVLDDGGEGVFLFLHQLQDFPDIGAALAPFNGAGIAVRTEIVADPVLQMEIQHPGMVLAQELN
jgi:hypothetical protein